MRKLLAVLLGGCLVTTGCSNSPERRDMARDKAVERGFTVTAIDDDWGVVPYARVTFGTCTGKVYTNGINSDGSERAVLREIPGFPEGFEIEDPHVKNIREDAAVKKACFAEEK